MYATNFADAENPTPLDFPKGAASEVFWSTVRTLNVPAPDRAESMAFGIGRGRERAYCIGLLKQKLAQMTKAAGGELSEELTAVTEAVLDNIPNGNFIVSTDDCFDKNGSVIFTVGRLVERDHVLNLATKAINGHANALMDAKGQINGDAWSDETDMALYAWLDALRHDDAAENHHNDGAFERHVESRRKAAHALAGAVKGFVPDTDEGDDS